MTDRIDYAEERARMIKRVDAEGVVTFEDGGVRQSAMGKGTYKFIPTIALKRLSHRYQYGEMKYGATDNFKKGLPTSDCWDSAMRHLVAYMDGDNSEDHLAAVAWNVFTIMEMEVNNTKWQDIESRKPFTPIMLDAEAYRDKAMEMLSGGHMK